jgi:hypothetical protein
MFVNPASLAWNKGQACRVKPTSFRVRRDYQAT